MLVISLLISGLLVSFYPTIRDSAIDFNEYLDAFPPAMKELFNLANADFSQFEIYISVEYLSIFWAMIFFPFIVSWGTQIGRDAERGHMAITLSYPVKRIDVILAYISDIKLKSLFATTILIGGIVGFALLIDVEMEYLNWIKYGFVVLLVMILAGAVTLLTAVFTLSSSKATYVAIGFLAGGYFLNLMSLLVEKLEFMKYLSIFYYYGDPSVILIEGSINWQHMSVLILAIFICFGTTIWVFKGKDLKEG
jgi:ABC-2 type transport system permease protein